MSKSDEDDEKHVTGEMIAVPLERLARLMRAGEHTHGLNPAQWEALRYLARANRFSNAPGILTRYIGATKGTISQTIKALEHKGLLVKSRRAGEKRSVALFLTPDGKALLDQDPWKRAVVLAGNLGNKTRRRLAKGLGEMLDAEVQHSNLPSFGSCITCRFFREKGRDGDASGPHLCMLFDEPLKAAECQSICSAHEPAA